MARNTRRRAQLARPDLSLRGVWWTTSRCLTVALAAAALLAGCSGESSTPENAAATTAADTAPGAVTSLRAGPVTLGDPDVVGPPYYPDAGERPPAAGPAASPQELLTHARDLVAARDRERENEAAALFTDRQLVERIPAGALRAAVVSLLGTIAEPAVGWLVASGRFASVRFGELDGATIARSLTDAGGLQHIVINRRFRFEDPALLSVVLAHEALHADARVSDLEELVATAVQAIVHMQQILADPMLADERTELAQATNAWVVIRLNTRRDGSSDLRLILDDTGPTVLPGGLDRPHFGAFFDPSASRTPGNAYLGLLLVALAEPGATPPDSVDFGLETVRFLDENQAVLSTAELVKVAAALGLRVEEAA